MYSKSSILLADYGWARRVHNDVLVQSKFSSVYAYYYTYNAEFTLAPVLLALPGKYPIVVEYLMHKVSEWFQMKVLGKERVNYGKSLSI